MVKKIDHNGLESLNTFIFNEFWEGVFMMEIIYLPNQLMSRSLWFGFSKTIKHIF